ncbi:MAG: hypothetical protein HY601_01335 [Candidatus Omnitrophica bacterium]|nr:hypothetical protein [Candidatus Omnitrophota bacterium]
MDLQEQWDRARRQTDIVRLRLQDLATFEATAVPYVFLAESALNPGDTVVRRGQVLIQRPAILLPDFSPQFEGFEFEVSNSALATFLLVRGIQFPSLRYQHEHSSLDVREGPLGEAVRHFTDRLYRAEDVSTGLVVGPEDAWQFSVLLLVGALVVRSADGDLRRILEEWRKRRRPS